MVNLVKIPLTSFYLIWRKFIEVDNKLVRTSISRLEKHAQGWVKVNVADACYLKKRNAAIGGLIRDYDDNFLLGFAQNLGFSYPLNAELWNALSDLSLAYKSGFKQATLEFDCKETSNPSKNLSSNCQLKNRIGMMLIFLLTSKYQIYFRGLQHYCRLACPYSCGLC